MKELFQFACDWLNKWDVRKDEAHLKDMQAKQGPEQKQMRKKAGSAAASLKPSRYGKRSDKAMQALSGSFMQAYGRLHGSISDDWFRWKSFGNLIALIFHMKERIYSAERGQGYWLPEISQEREHHKIIAIRNPKMMQVGEANMHYRLGLLLEGNELARQVAPLFLEQAKSHPRSFSTVAACLAFAWEFHLLACVGIGGWHIQICRACGKFFPAKRSDALTCKTYCRKQVQLAKEGKTPKQSLKTAKNSSTLRRKSAS